LALAALPAEPAPDPPKKPAPVEPRFPPPAFDPPEARSAAQGDGEWSPVGGAPASPMVRTTVHPDRGNGHVYVAIVAVDLERVSVRLVAGTLEPLSETVPRERRPGLVPAADQTRLLAVFNGGFMVHHGQWGMSLGADTFLPLKPEGCSVVISDRAVEIRTHAALTTPPDERLAVRQTPPCLVERGAVNRALMGGEKPRAWGMSETGGIEIRRSALGTTADGRTLLYGLGESVTPREMAQSMRAAGAVDAAELDVNWSYTRFLFYAPAPDGREPQVTSTLIPKIKHGPGLYVRKASERDFFYLVRRE